MSSYFQGTIKNLIYRLRRFNEVLDSSLAECVQQDERLLIYYVQQQQLYDRGENGDEVEIMSYAPYAERTIQNKKKAGQPYDRVTLKKTGKFYRSMYLHVDDEGFAIRASDEKTDKLVAKYGAKILRLTDRNFNWYIRHILRQRLTAELKKRLKTNG